MLTIKYMFGNDEVFLMDKSEFTKLRSIGERCDGVYSLTASDKELDYITARFRNIPKSLDAKSQRWHGDTAKTIVYGLGQMFNEMFR